MMDSNNEKANIMSCSSSVQTTKTKTNKIQNNKEIKAILFDMDGTLLDTEALSDKAILMSFGSDDNTKNAIPPKVFQIEPMSNGRLPWELKKQILGLRGKEWIPIVKNYAIQHWNANKDLIPTDDEFQKNWEDNLTSMCDEIDACTGAIELVQEFATKTNLPMAIATSSRYVGVEKKRKRHEAMMFKHITEIVAGDDIAVKNGKPSPDIYIEAAKRLNVHPSHCLVFEDALTGIQSGKGAGCHVVAIPDPRFDDDEKKTFRKLSDVVLNNLWDFDGSIFGIDEVNMTKSATATAAKTCCVANA